MRFYSINTMIFLLTVLVGFTQAKNIYKSPKKIRAVAFFTPAGTTQQSADLYKQIADTQTITRIIIVAAAPEVPFCGIVLPTVDRVLVSGSLPLDLDCHAMLSRQSAYFAHAAFLDSACVHKKAVARTKQLIQTDTYTHDPFEQADTLKRQLEICSQQFLQAKVMPLLVGTLTEEDAQQIAKFLKDCVDKNTLVVLAGHRLLADVVTPMQLEDLVSLDSKQHPDKHALMVLVALAAKKSWGTPTLTADSSMIWAV